MPHPPWPLQFAPPRRNGRRRLRPHAERQLRILRQFVLVRQLDVASRARRRILHALADQLHARPRRAHGDLHRQSRARPPAPLAPCRSRPASASPRRLDSFATIGSSSLPIVGSIFPGVNVTPSSVRFATSSSVAALQHALRVAGVQRKAVQMPGRRIRAQRNRLRRHRPVLLHLQLQRPRMRLLQRQAAPAT